MNKLSGLEPQRVFKYFEEICSIPHGSENMDAIAAYCARFAENHSLKYIRDEANNVIIYKDGCAGLEQSSPIILQGHLDMVCQRDEGREIDFLRDGLDIYVDGDFVRARGTTLGADNGIAVAMIMAILESKDIPHPPIEAVFTTDEEIGMIGAGKLDCSLLSGHRMINLDAEEPDTPTVSCAGGSDFRVSFDVQRKAVRGYSVKLNLSGLQGGHSGVEINSGRINADVLMGRVLNHLSGLCDFELAEIGGGDKSNAIPPYSAATLVTCDPEGFKALANEYLQTVKSEISDRESGFSYSVDMTDGETEVSVIGRDTRDAVIRALFCAPNGVMDMSADIEGLVETSLNLGILKTEEKKIILHYALRSNKSSALSALEERMTAFFKPLDCLIEAFGHYPPWEFNSRSEIQNIYNAAFFEQFGSKPCPSAIHAGLECGVFASKIKDFDAIAIGPKLCDVHTTSEALSISSTAQIFELLLKILKNCK